MKYFSKNNLIVAAVVAPATLGVRYGIVAAYRWWNGSSSEKKTEKNSKTTTETHSKSA